jgi:riboflavin biosynthesis pyrimidine reductase
MLRRIDQTGEPIDDLVGMVMDEPRTTDRGPWVMLNFVSSIDGATRVAGKSTALNDADDKALFAALRAVPDIILVGAATVSAEDYGPVRLDERRREQRVAAGKTPAPILAIVSGSLSIDPEARVFSDPEYRPMIISGPNANPSKLAMLGDSADVVFLEEVTAPAILERLGAAAVILCEGGPQLAGQFVGRGLVDEMNLTISPKLVGGDAPRLAHGLASDPPSEMALDRVLMGERSLFLRYLRA